MFAFVALHLPFSDKKAPLAVCWNPYDYTEHCTQCQLTDIQCQVDSSSSTFAAIILSLHPNIAYCYSRVITRRPMVPFKALMKTSAATWDEYSSWPTPRITPNVTHPCHHSKTTCLWFCALCVCVCAPTAATHHPHSFQPASSPQVMPWCWCHPRLARGLCQQLLWVTDDITARI